MKEMGRQFVLGEDIIAAMKRAAKMEEKGSPTPTTCWAKPPALKLTQNVITLAIRARFQLLPPHVSMMTFKATQRRLRNEVI